MIFSDTVPTKPGHYWAMLTDFHNLPVVVYVIDDKKAVYLGDDHESNLTVEDSYYDEPELDQWIWGDKINPPEKVTIKIGYDKDQICDLWSDSFWCMCKDPTGWSKDFKTTCIDCGGVDALKTHGLRPWDDDE